MLPIETILEDDKKILEQVKEMVSSEVFEDILLYMSDSSNGNFDIVDESSIKETRHEYEAYAFKYIYLVQYWEDDLCGKIWIPLGNGKVFKYDYCV